MNRVEFIRKISEETMLPMHEVENALNAIFANFKTLLSKEEIARVASCLEAPDLKSLWKTASLPQNDEEYD